jgi:5,5'-dehydrodivanillate O-demethylase oxygenase subunit
LTPEENARLIQVGPGTPTGDLMRRYWQPVAAVGELQQDPVKSVRLLGESLVLFRDRSARLGLIAEACMHRGTSLAYGIPEERGIRCAYHGWLYDTAGQCLEQPAEPAKTAFHQKIQTVSYPVRELGGLIFAYLGPEPAPTLPRYNVLAWPNSIRESQGSVIPANWLQVMENLMDPAHVEFLHGRFFAYALEKQDKAKAHEFRQKFAPAPLKKMAFERFEGGIIERHSVGNDAAPTWKIGTSTFFPNATMAGTPADASMIFIVPMDDTHTWFLMHLAERPAGPVPAQAAIRFRDIPGTDAAGKFITGMANGQDHLATVTQGPVAPREREHLGASDAGVLLYRELLTEQLALLERGDDPLNVLRGPGPELIDFPKANQTISYNSSRI